MQKSIYEIANKKTKTKSKSIIHSPYLSRILLPPIEVHVDEGDSREGNHSDNDEHRIGTQSSSEDASRRLNDKASIPAAFSGAESIRRAEIVIAAKESAADEAEPGVGEGGGREREAWVEGQ